MLILPPSQSVKSNSVDFTANQVMKFSWSTPDSYGGNQFSGYTPFGVACSKSNTGNLVLSQQHVDNTVCFPFLGFINLKYPRKFKFKNILIMEFITNHRIY